MPNRVNKLAIAERRTAAIRLRRSGLSWEEIAEELGYRSRGAACQDVARALGERLKEQRVELDGLRELEDGHLDDLRSTMMDLIRSGRADAQLKATDRLVRISERKAKLHGLDHSDGLEERRVALAEAQLDLLDDVLRRVLTALGLDPSALEVREVVHRELTEVAAEALG